MLLHPSRNERGPTEAMAISCLALRPRPAPELGARSFRPPPPAQPGAWCARVCACALSSRPHLRWTNFKLPDPESLDWGIAS